MLTRIDLVLCCAISLAIFIGHILLSRHLKEKWQRRCSVPYLNREHNNPQLHTINGIGCRFIGHFRDITIDNRHTYLTYYSFVFFFIPLFSIRAYRVIDGEGESYYILGSEKMDIMEILCIFLSWFKWVAVVLSVWFVILWWY